MRIGIFGGTFDPIHTGHLILAEQAREQGQLDQVWFLPAPRPPQKEGNSITRYDLRVEMLQLALAGRTDFLINEVEHERDGPSYTIDTLTELKRRYPDHQFFLILGGDSLADLPLWREPQGIIAQAGLLVMARPGVAVMSEEELRQRLNLSVETKLSLQILETPQIDIASRYLRRNVAQGRSIRYLVPRAVEVLIENRGLYR
jgi:nicotinate-nucleotide adenylyltransferase